MLKGDGRYSGCFSSGSTWQEISHVVIGTSTNGCKITKLRHFCPLFYLLQTLRNWWNHRHSYVCAVTGSFCSKLFSVPDCLSAGIFHLLLFTFLTLLGCQCLNFDCSNFCLSNTYIFVPAWWKTTLVQAVQRTEEKREFTKVGKKSQSLGSRLKGHNQLHKQGTNRASAQLSPRLSSQGGHSNV